MRDIKALAFVCVLIAACATTGGEGGDDGVDPPSGATCGDAVCAASEIGVCQADCGSGGPSTEVCGNAKCEGNEPTTCAADCATTAVCGNGQCESSESNSTCPGDCTTTGGGGTCPSDPIECTLCVISQGAICPTGQTMTTCQACILGGGGGLPMCSGGAPNGVCDAGETNATCPLDCP
ncbi:MAG: hypothetical protein M4D80_05520 [Myxococcota bacterium]|nr:hypothetical protein [Deltaproteobacteria bacterium]MDQ3334597.1 hypothetical protein [Myxococcota bacterium]